MIGSNVVFSPLISVTFLILYLKKVSVYDVLFFDSPFLHFKPGFVVPCEGLGMVVY